MKQPVHKRTEAEVHQRYPLADRLPGWFFRVEESSPGHFVAEGTDLWGRVVSISGGDDALARAVEAARGIGAPAENSLRSN